VSEQHEAVQVHHEGVIVVRGDGGELVARKAVREVDRPRLVHELSVLRLLRGLDVTRPVDPHATGQDGAVDLVYVGSRTLADAMAELAAPRLLAVLKATAALLHAAHERGVCHRRVDASHVLLGPGDQVVLCGWSEAGVGTPVTGGDATAAPDGGAGRLASPGASNASSTARFDPAIDVAAVGELAQQAVETNQVLTARARTQLAAVATAARHPDPTVRPPMHELARVLTAPAGAAPSTPEAADRHTSDGGDRGRRPLVARVGIGLAAAVVAAVATVQCAGGAARPAAPLGDAAPASTPNPVGPTTLDGSPTVPPDAGDGELAATGAAPANSSTTLAGEELTAAACPTTAEELALAGLPASCAGLVRLEGERLRVAELTYTLGRPGDVAGLTDATCDGRLEPTLVEAGTGRLFVFDQWAAPGQPTPSRPLGTVSGATGLSDPLGATCGTIRVTLSDGGVVDLPSNPSA
jgi:hypothetical protein